MASARALGWLLASVALGLGVPAHGQSAKDNAQKDAEDAFGGSVGLENVGIYTTTNVRGFDPQKAGNARVDGVYFDQISTVSARSRDITTIRVGFAALDTFGPSPTGIVAYRLHPSGDEFGGSLGLSSTAYGEAISSLLLRVPVVEGHVSFAGGFAYAGQQFADGARNDNFGWGILPRVRFGGIELKGVFSGYRIAPDKARPIVQTAGAFLPVIPQKGLYLGQDWARGKNFKITNGFTLRADIAQGLQFRGGAFRSRWDHHRKFTEIYRVLDPSGQARHLLLADPKQDNYSNSWEGLFSYRFGDKRLSHTLFAGARGRFRHIESGGSAFFDYGVTEFGLKDPQPKPQFHFGLTNLGKLRQVAYSVGYMGKWDGVGQINLGLNKTDYDASFTNALGTSHSRANPWLYNASLLVKPARWLSVYVGAMTGLEDNGSAPENAANRGEQLPAVKTRQIDGGVQAKFGKMTLVASLFQIEKPYFSFDGANVYSELGQVKHRGGEISLMGDVTDRLHVLAGAVVMDPVVSGPARDIGLVGKRPVGVAKIHARADFSWRTDLPGALTVTGGMGFDSKRAASAQPFAELGNKQLFLPSRLTFDIGLRNKFKLGSLPSSLRFVVENLFDRKSWDTIASNSLQPGDRRRWSLYLISDF